MVARVQSIMAYYLSDPIMSCGEGAFTEQGICMGHREKRNAMIIRGNEVERTVSFDDPIPIMTVHGSIVTK